MQSRPHGLLVLQYRGVCKEDPGTEDHVIKISNDEMDICRIHVEEYHEPVFALSSRLFCHL